MHELFGEVRNLPTYAAYACAAGAGVCAFGLGTIWAARKLVTGARKTVAVSLVGAMLIGGMVVVGTDDAGTKPGTNGVNQAEGGTNTVGQTDGGAANFAPRMGVVLGHGIPKPNGWPTRTQYPGRWKHSDMKDVAFYFNHKFYQKVVEKGVLE